MSGYTKGPWKAIYSEKRDNYQIWGNGHWIANTKCESTPRDHEANANVIAASPELLDCLKEARNHLDNADIDLAYIDEVIAKAEGRG